MQWWRVFVGAASVTVTALAGCTGAWIGPTVPSGTAGGVYHDPRGWSISVEPGWRVTTFASSGSLQAAGAQIADVALPKPIIRPGYPIQADGLALPDTGIALVIGTDDDPKVSPQGPISTLPLSWPKGWTEGSCVTDNPCMDTIWFHEEPGGTIFTATIKIGQGVWGDNGRSSPSEQGKLDDLTRMISTLSF